MTDTVPMPDLSDWHSPDRKSITEMLRSHAAAVSAADNAALRAEIERLLAVMRASLHEEDARHTATIAALSKRVEELEVALRSLLAVADEWQVGLTAREAARALLSQPKEPT